MLSIRLVLVVYISLVTRSLLLSTKNDCLFIKINMPPTALYDPRPLAAAYVQKMRMGKSTFKLDRFKKQEHFVGMFQEACYREKKLGSKSNLGKKKSCRSLISR